MTQVNPIWAQIHSVAADGTTTFSGPVIANGNGLGADLSLSGAEAIPDNTSTIAHITSNPSITSAGTAPNGNAYYNYQTNPVLSGTNGLATFAGFWGNPSFTGSGTVTAMFGSAGRVTLQGAGTVTEMMGLYGTCEFGSLSGSGTVATAAGLNIHNISAQPAATTVTNLYGVWVQAQAVTTLNVTNNIGANIGMSSGATTRNVGIVIGGMPSVVPVNALLYGTMTLTDPVTISENSTFTIKPTFALTANNAFNMRGLLMTATTTNTAFNYTGTVNGIEANLNWAGTGTGGTVQSFFGNTQVNTGVNNGTITAANGAQLQFQHFGVGTVTTAIGVLGRSLLRASGTGADGNISTAVGVRGEVDNLGTSATPGVISAGICFDALAPTFSTTGTISSQYGLWIHNQGNAKVTTVACGIRIDAQSGATGNTALAIGGGPTTGNWAIYSTSTSPSQFAGLLTTVLSATSGAGFRLPHGAAPTSPVDGDMWSTTAGLFIRINGVNKTVTLT